MERGTKEEYQGNEKRIKPIIMRINEKQFSYFSKHYTLLGYGSMGPHLEHFCGVLSIGFDGN